MLPKITSYTDINKIFIFYNSHAANATLVRIIRLSTVLLFDILAVSSSLLITKFINRNVTSKITQTENVCMYVVLRVCAHQKYEKKTNKAR